MVPFTPFVPCGLWVGPTRGVGEKAGGAHHLSPLKSVLLLCPFEEWPHTGEVVCELSSGPSLGLFPWGFSPESLSHVLGKIADKKIEIQFFI